MDIYYSLSQETLKVGAGRELSRKSPGVGVPDGHTGMSNYLSEGKNVVKMCINRCS